MSLVAVFRHRMCRGLWAEIPTFAVQHSERVTATRSLCTPPTQTHHQSIYIDDRNLPFSCFAPQSFSKFKAYTVTAPNPSESVKHRQTHRCTKFDFGFVFCLFSQYIFWHFQPSAVTLFTVCHHSFIESHYFPPLLFVVSVCPLLLWLSFVRRKIKPDPIEETSLGYVSRFAMISFFFAFGLVVLYLNGRYSHNRITEYLWECLKSQDRAAGTLWSHRDRHAFILTVQWILICYKCEICFQLALSV